MPVRRLQLAVAVAVLILTPRLGSATLKFGAIQVSGAVQSQNIVRNPDVDTFEFVQNRNIARLQLEYGWLQGGRFIDKYDIPFVDRSSLYVLWRGVYDSIYDT